MDNKIPILSKLLNDDDTETITYVSKALVEYGLPARQFLLENKYLSNSEVHYKNIEHVIHKINLELVKKQLCDYLATPHQETLDIFWQSLDLLYTDNEEKYELFKTFRTQVIQRAWLFMTNENNVLQAISILHCLLIVNLDLKTISDFGIVSLDPKRSRPISTKRNIISHINLPQPTFFQILKEGYRIKIVGLSVENKTKFENFFFSNLPTTACLSYYSYIKLMHYFLDIFAYKTEVVIVETLKIDLSEDEEEDSYTFTPSFYMKTDASKHTEFKLYDVANHEFVDIKIYEKNETQHIKTTYIFSETESNPQFKFYIYPISEKTFLKSIIEAMKSKAPDNFKSDFDELIQIFTTK